MPTVKIEAIMRLKTSGNPSTHREHHVSKIHWGMNKTWVKTVLGGDEGPLEMANRLCNCSLPQGSVPSLRITLWAH